MRAFYKHTIPVFIILSSCLPYQPYHTTYYNMRIDLNPESGMIDANLQMVYVPSRDHTDSIILLLDEGYSIGSLSAQELARYDFDKGRLILYIEETINTGDQFHISINYSGSIKLTNQPGEDVFLIDRNLKWFPHRNDIHDMEYNIRLVLPEEYAIKDYKGSTDKLNEYLIESLNPSSDICFQIQRKIESK